MKCPGFEQLVDYLDGKLTPAGAEQFAAHLAAGCADCAENRRVKEAPAAPRNAR